MTSPTRSKKKLSRVSRSGLSGSANAAMRALLGADASRDVSFKTGKRQGVMGAGETQKYPPPPESWLGTLPEWAIFWAHLSLGLEPRRDFEYQYSIGGAMVDFYEYDALMAIEIQGLYWHYGLGAAKQGDDLQRKIQIESLGIAVIFIDEDDALADPVYYLREARNGIDHSRSGTGMI